MLCLSAGKAGGVTSLHTLPRPNVWNVAWCEVSLGMRTAALMRRMARSIEPIADWDANTALPLKV